MRFLIKILRNDKFEYLKIPNTVKLEQGELGYRIVEKTRVGKWRKGYHLAYADTPKSAYRNVLKKLIKLNNKK